MVVHAGARRPLVVGIGGTGRPGSATERALTLALRGATDCGAEVQLFGGAFLGRLPLFQPHLARRSGHALELLDAVARADGLIVASPSYHAGVSAMVKNAFDHMEDLRDDPRPYLDRRAVGCVVTSTGCQAGGITLSALRSIVHALRGWPTPFGAAVNTGAAPHTAGGQPFDDAVDRCVVQLHTVGHQVTEFARLFGAALPTEAGMTR
jgi:FMN reductase